MTSGDVPTVPAAAGPAQVGYGPRAAAPTGEPLTVEPTGDAAVDAAVRAVVDVAGAPPADQLPAFEAAHRTLREALARIDEG